MDECSVLNIRIICIIERKRGLCYIIYRFAIEIIYRFVIESFEEQRIILEQFDVDIHMPFPNDLFDGIFHVNTYYFLPNLDNVADELYRIMKPNAHIVAILDMQRLRQYVDRGLMQFGNVDPIPYLVALELAGFKNVRVEYIPDDSRGKSHHIQV